MRDILIIIPTRSSGGTRVQSLDRLIKSWRKTTYGYSDIMCVFDKDDVHHYTDILPPLGQSWVMERDCLVGKLNKVATQPQLLANYHTLCFVGDDVVFETDGWDERITDWMLGHHPGVCYCNDLLQGENLPNNVFLSSEIVKAQGFMCPPELKHYYIDNYWKDLGIRLGSIKYFPDIIIEHLHWSNNKSEKDALYSESEKMMGEDQRAFDKYRMEKFDSDIQKIKSYERYTFEE
jgi:hypothetical protein